VGFVVNSGSETLSRLDFSENSINNSFAVLGSMPNRLALTTDYGYVVNSGDNNVQKINLQTGETEALIFIGFSTNPYDIIIEENFAYVTGGLINKVYKIDLSTDQVVSSVNVGSNPAGLAVYGNKLYVGNTDYANYYANCSVSVISLSSFELLYDILTELNPQYLSIINDKVHISCGGNWGNIEGKICILDPVSDEIISVIDIGGITTNMATTPSNSVYVGDGFGYSLYAYSAENYEVIYNSTNPFLPGGTMVAANMDNFFVLGGEWGQNFVVRKYDFAENLLAEYEVALYATDLKLQTDAVNSNDDVLQLSSISISSYPNPFSQTDQSKSGYITFKIDYQLQPEKNSDNCFEGEINIYNIRGQRVRCLPISEMNSSSVIWDGYDDFGKKQSSGVYFFNLILKNKIAAANRLLIIR
jgi:YVTN family beta-propeller protein